MTARRTPRTTSPKLEELRAKNEARLRERKVQARRRRGREHYRREKQRRRTQKREDEGWAYRGKWLIWWDNLHRPLSIARYWNVYEALPEDVRLLIQMEKSIFALRGRRLEILRAYERENMRPGERPRILTSELSACEREIKRFRQKIQELALSCAKNGSIGYAERLVAEELEKRRKQAQEYRRRKAKRRSEPSEPRGPDGPRESQEPRESHESR